MFGDSDPSSTMGSARLGEMSLAEREVSFHHKRLTQRAAIVGGGPLANFLFAIVTLSLLFATYGQPYTPAEVGQVQTGSAAEKGGIKVGDTIVDINGTAINRFEDVQQIVRLNPGEPMVITVKRDGQSVALHVTPARSEVTDRFGDRHEYGLLGIGRSGVEYVKRNPVAAVGQAFSETWNLSVSTLQAMWQIVIGTRGSDELGGPLRIAQMSGEIAQTGLVPLLWFMSVLSINLGLINLFPVPVLDGGHLLFYAAEAIRGKPLGQRAQEYGFRIGLALVLTLMVFATWNDVLHWWRS
jgi:regulator of sigma E protease